MKVALPQKSQKQEINGVLLLNKPQGKSAHHALQMVKRLFSAKKAGHTGTLDPLATGLLPICFGEATKFSQFLLNANKQYWAQARLGIKTQTGDSEGKILSQCSSIPPFTQSDILSILMRFQGTSLQKPPSFSALKHQGKPLYYWARQGIEIQKPAREIHIHKLTLLEYKEALLTLDVHCSKGTYIRKLIEAIGDALGCGAHMTALHRLQVGTYHANQMLSMDYLSALTPEERLKQLLPVENSLPESWPIILLSEEEACFLFRGVAVNPTHGATMPNSPPDQKLRLVLKTNRQFIGIGQKLEDGKITPYRLIKAL